MSTTHKQNLPVKLLATVSVVSLLGIGLPVPTHAAPVAAIAAPINTPDIVAYASNHPTAVESPKTRRSGNSARDRRTPPRPKNTERTGSKAVLQPSVLAQREQVMREISFRIDRTMRSKLPTMQWTMENADAKDERAILDGDWYQLANTVLKKGIKNQWRVRATNLGWLGGNSTKRNVQIKRQRGKGPVRYGDVVAFKISKYGWLKHKKVHSGINLGGDKKPQYQWIVRGGTTGTKFVTGMPFALQNAKVKNEVTYCTRAYGINLGWQGVSKCNSWKAKLSNRAFGANGLFARDGWSGIAFKAGVAYLCKAGVTAAGKVAIAKTGGTTAKVVGALIPVAIKQCIKRI